MGVRSHLYGNLGQRLLQHEADGSLYALQASGASSTGRMVDGSGSVEATFELDAFGVELSRSGMATTPWLFAGGAGMYTGSTGNPIGSGSLGFMPQGSVWDPADGQVNVGGSRWTAQDWQTIIDIINGGWPDWVVVVIGGGGNVGPPTGGGDFGGGGKGGGGGTGMGGDVGLGWPEPCIEKEPCTYPEIIDFGNYLLQVGACMAKCGLDFKDPTCLLSLIDTIYDNPTFEDWYEFFTECIAGQNSFMGFLLLLKCLKECLDDPAEGIGIDSSLGRPKPWQYCSSRWQELGYDSCDECCADPKMIGRWGKNAQVYCTKCCDEEKGPPPLEWDYKKMPT